MTIVASRRRQWPRSVRVYCARHAGHTGRHGPASSRRILRGVGEFPASREIFRERDGIHHERVTAFAHPVHGIADFVSRVVRRATVTGLEFA